MGKLLQLLFVGAVTALALSQPGSAQARGCKNGYYYYAPYYMPQGTVQYYLVYVPPSGPERYYYVPSAPTGERYYYVPPQSSDRTSHSPGSSAPRLWQPGDSSPGLTHTNE